MAHYAFLDENNIVTEVIAGRNEDEVVNGISDWEAYYGAKKGQRCVRTSYNANIRKKYATIGDTYDENLDAFIRPQPFPSWTLDSDLADWVPPFPKPEGLWAWDESTQNWVESLD